MLFTTYFSSFGDCPPAQPIYSLITSASFLSISVQLRPIIIQAHVAAKSNAAPPVLRACLSGKIPDNLPSAWMSSRWKIALRYIIKSAVYLHWLSKRGVGRRAPKRSSIELNGEEEKQEQKQTRTRTKTKEKKHGEGGKGQHRAKVHQRIRETKLRTTTKEI